MIFITIQAGKYMNINIHKIKSIETELTHHWKNDKTFFVIRTIKIEDTDDVESEIKLFSDNEKALQFKEINENEN